MKQLPSKYKKIYKEHYIDYASKESLFRKIIYLFESWYHRKAGEIYPNAKKILDVGAGSLSHLTFESNYQIYDIVEPKEYLLKHSKLKILKISNRYLDLKNIPKDNQYDKILSIMVLEHVRDLDNHLKEISNKLTDSGLFVIEMAAQDDFLYWLSWRCSTGLFFCIRHGLDYGVLMRYERINSYDEIIINLKRYFSIKEIKSFPFNLRNFRIYQHLVCKKIKL